MKELILLLSMLVTLTTAPWVVTGHVEEARQDRVVVVGTVVAYNLSLLSFVRLSSVANNEVILVRVRRRLTGSVKSRYLIVRYEYWDKEPILPDGFHSAAAQWRLELVRDPACDKPSAEILSSKSNPGLVILAPLHQLLGRKRPEASEKIPCYVLRPNGFGPAQVVKVTK